jgi:hypothetical protein
MSRSSEAVARPIAEALSERLEADDFRGWDPFDALSSPALRAIARGRRARQAAIQSLKRLPVNPRPMLGVPRQEHVKGLALCASAYAQLSRKPGDRWNVLARAMASRLAARALRTDDEAAWGYDFDVQTRWGFYRRGTPNAIATSFAVNGILDARPDGGGRELAQAAIRFAVRHLAAGGDARHFTYYPGATAEIHNASALLADAIGRVLPWPCPERALARGAVERLLEAERPPGCWPYGEQPGLEWVDGFHTGYVLVALHRWDRSEPDPAVSAAVARGLDFYVSRLFELDGAPRHSVNSLYPIDIHAASTAIWTLSLLRERDERALPTAERVLRWTLRHLRRDDGRFAFQLRRRVQLTVPYIRWSDAHMLLALATYDRAASPPAAAQPDEPETAAGTAVTAAVSDVRSPGRRHG